MTPSLGGPGVACSAMRVRRLEAGELAAEERARTEAHLAECARCQRVRDELARERARLDEALPFDTFAAGVAERLARAEARPARRTFRRAALALAAGLAVAAAAPLVFQATRDDPSFRVKGGAELTVYVRAADEARALAPGEPVPPGAALRLGLAPAGRREAAVVLVDADGAAPLYAGPAVTGLLPGAFEWTGAGGGTIVAVLDDLPVDAGALARRVGAGGVAAAAPRPAAEVIVVRLTRGTP